MNEEEEQNSSQQGEPDEGEVDNQQPPQQEEEDQESTEDEEDKGEDKSEEDTGEEDSEGEGGADGADGGSSDNDTYNEEAMREARDRKLIFDRLTELRSVLTTLSRHSEELYSAKDSFSSVTNLPKNVWKKISYVNEVSEQKIDQITTVLRTDIITKLDVDRLYKVFLALQRITTELIDILERADHTLYPPHKQ